MKILSMPVQKRRQKGLRVSDSHFYGSFSNEITAVKGLSIVSSQKFKSIIHVLDLQEVVYSRVVKAFGLGSRGCRFAANCMAEIPQTWCCFLFLKLLQLLQVGGATLVCHALETCITRQRCYQCLCVTSNYGFIHSLDAARHCGNIEGWDIVETLKQETWKHSRMRHCGNTEGWDIVETLWQETWKHSRMRHCGNI